MKKNQLALIIALLLPCAITLHAQIEYKFLLEKENNCTPISLSSTKTGDAIVGLFYSDISQLIKLDSHGNVVASHLFAPEEDSSYYLNYTTFCAELDCFLGVGVQYIGNMTECRQNIWIFEFDENLNILREKVFSTFSYCVLSMSGQYANDCYYIVASAYPDDDLTMIYKIDSQWNQILQKAEISNGYGGTTCFMRQIPGSSNFLIDFGLDDKYLYILDENLNEISELKYNLIDLRYPIDGEFINEKEVITTGIYVEDGGNTFNYLFGLKKTDITGDINMNQLEIFGYEWLDEYDFYAGCRTGERKSLAMHEDYFYYGGVGNYNLFTYYGFEDNALVLYAFDHNLDSLWSMTVADDAYYKLWSIVPTEDGGCVMAAWRSDWRQGKNKWDTYIVKIAKPEFNNIAALPKNDIVVYPNPGNDKLFIKTEMREFTFQLYDMQGKLLLEQQNDKEIHASGLSSGLYLYKIIDAQGKMSTGKWIKR